MVGLRTCTCNVHSRSKWGEKLLRYNEPWYVGSLVSASSWGGSSRPPGMCLVAHDTRLRPVADSAPRPRASCQFCRKRVSVEPVDGIPIERAREMKKCKSLSFFLFHFFWYDNEDDDDDYGTVY